MIKSCDDMDKKKFRMKKLIEHWIEHNDEHNTRYGEAVKEAVEFGQANVAIELKEAVEAGKEVSKHLHLAKDKIKG